MYLTDLHVHSDVSMDCSIPMCDMAAAEAAAGIETMCFTNHCDLLRYQDSSFNPRCLEIVPESLQKLSELRESGRVPLEVLLGIELAESCSYPEIAAEIAASEGLDFVIGSLHILPGIGDFYFQKYTSPEVCYDYFDRYLDKLQELAEWGHFDVMAHIGYVRRYMWRQGQDCEMTLARYGDRIERLLRTLIGKGLGIEINCSGLRDGCGPFPNEETLRLYRALGGEIVTVGSDAHTPELAAKCVREGYQVLRDCGFGYVTVFRERKPEFIGI